MVRLVAWFILGLLLACAPVFAASAPQSISLIRNGSFDQNVDGWRQPDSSWSWGKQTFGPSWGEGQSGGALVLDGQGRKLVGRTYQPLAAKDWPPSLLLSGSIKARNLPHGWYAYARLICMDGSYKWLANTWISVGHDQADGQWHDLKAELSVPDGTVHVWLVVRCDQFDQLPDGDNNTFAAFDNLSVIPQRPNLETAQPQAGAKPDRKLLRDNLLYTPGLWRTGMNDVSVAPHTDGQTLVIPWNGSHIGTLTQGVEIPTGTAMTLRFQGRTVGDTARSKVFLRTQLYDEQKRVITSDFTINQPLSSAWQSYEQRFDIPAGLLKQAEVGVSVSPSSQQSAGQMEVRNIQLTAAPTREQRLALPAAMIVRCVDRQQASVYVPGQQPIFDVTLANNRDQKQTLQLKAVLCDDAGKAMETFTRELTLEPMSQGTITLDQLPPASKVGYYLLPMALMNQTGRPIDQMVRSFMVIDPPNGAPNDPVFGLSVYRTSANLAPVYGKIGIGAVLELLDWPTIEPVRGQYWFGQNDQEFRQYREAGIKAYGFFGAEMMNQSYLVPGWEKPSFDQWLKTRDPQLRVAHFQALEQFAHAAIQRYADQVDIWHVKNEIDGTMHSSIDEPSARYYIDFVKTISRVAHSLDPTAKISALGVTSRDVNNDYRCLRPLWAVLKDDVDECWPHPYASPRNIGPGRTVQATDDFIRASFQGASAIGAAYGKPDVGSSEIGYAVAADQPVNSVYQRDMAKLSARMAILCRSLPQLKFLGYFTAIATSPTSESYDHGYSYGLWDKEEPGFSTSDQALFPRPVAMTYAAAIRLLSHVSDQIVVDVAKNMYLCAFRKDAGYVIAAWTSRPSPVPLQVDLPHAVQTRSMFGTPLDELAAGRQKIQLSDEPLYLICPQGDYAAILQALKNSHADLPQLAVATRITGWDQVQLVVANQIAQPLQAAVMGPNQKEQTFDLKPAGQTTLNFSNVHDQDIFAFQMNGQRLVHKVELQPIGVARAPKPIVLTGKTESLSHPPPLLTFDESSLYPPDAKSWGQWTGPADLSGKLWFSWDAENLYIVCEVHDDIHVQEQRGHAIWAYDSMVVAIDAGNDALPKEVSGTSGYDADDYELCLALNPTVGPVGACYHASSATLMEPDKLPPFRVTREGQITRYEVAIPWSYLPPLKPQPGSAFKANVVVTDSDAPGEPAKYWMGITHGIHTGKNPELYKTFILK